jgi:hypothetical protein
MTALTNESSELTVDTTATPVADRIPWDWTWLNWALTLLATPAAVLVMNSALGAAMSTTGCSLAACPDLASSGLLFNVLYYGAPVVAGVMILLSLFTATRRRGIVVPLLGWGLLLADAAVLAGAFGG